MWVVYSIMCEIQTYVACVGLSSAAKQILEVESFFDKTTLQRRHVFKVTH